MPNEAELENTEIKDPSVSEGERNAQTVPMDEIIARQRRERDENIAAESVEEKVAVAAVEPEIDEVPQVVAPAVESKEVDNSPIKDNNFVVKREGVEYLLTTQNGRQVEVPLDQVQAIVQKQNNADVQTAQAVQKQRQYEGLIEGQKNMQESTPRDDTPAVAINREKLNDALKKLVDDDIDVAGDAIANVLDDALRSTQVSSAPMTQQQVREIAGEAIENSKLGLAFEAFKKNPKYARIIRDKALLDKVDECTERLIADKSYMASSRSYLEILNAAGNEVLNWGGNLFSGKIIPPTEKSNPFKKPIRSTANTQQKIAQKRAHNSSVKSAAARRGVEEAPPPRTHSQIIADMAKARGQKILT